MAHYRVSKRYAKGFMDFLEGNPLKAQAVQEMDVIINTINNNRALRTFFTNPVFEPHKKITVFDEIFKTLSVATKRFVHLIIRQGRSNALLEVAKQVKEQDRVERGVKKLKIISAVELSNEQRQGIVDKVQNKLGSDVILEVKNIVDKDIIGGFILRIDDMQIDDSIQSKLERMKQGFTQNLYVPKHK